MLMKLLNVNLLLVIVPAAINMGLSFKLLIEIFKIIKNNKSPIYLNWLSKGTIINVLLNVLMINFFCMSQLNSQHSISVFNHFAVFFILYIFLWQSRFITYSSKMIQKLFILLIHLLLCIALFCFIYSMYRETFIHEYDDGLELLYRLKPVYIVFGYVLNTVYFIRSFFSEKFSKTVVLLFFVSIVSMTLIAASIICETPIARNCVSLSFLVYLFIAYRFVVNKKGRYLNDHK